MLEFYVVWLRSCCKLVLFHVSTIAGSFVNLQLLS